MLSLSWTRSSRTGGFALPEIVLIFAFRSDRSAHVSYILTKYQYEGKYLKYYAVPSSLPMNRKHHIFIIRARNSDRIQTVT